MGKAGCAATSPDGERWGVKGSGDVLLLHGTPSPRVTRKEFPCLALLQYLCEKQAAQCCPTPETEAMQALQLVRQGRSKGCFVPASFWRVFSLYLARFYAIVFLIVFRAVAWCGL